MKLAAAVVLLSYFFAGSTEARDLKGMKSMSARRGKKGKKGKKGKSKAPHVQVGDRPYFLIDSMKPSALKVQLGKYPSFGVPLASHRTDSS